MMKKFALSAAALGLALSMSGCKGLTFKGSLNVIQPITVETQTEKKDPFCNISPETCRPPEMVIEKHTYQAGAYQANIQYINRNQINLNLNNQAPIVLSIPREVTLPDVSGEFDLTAAQVGQGFDIHGKLDTAVAESQPRRDRESCTISEPYNYCYWVPGPGGGYQTCRTEWRTRYGWQEVEYFVRNTRKNVTLDLRAPGTADVLSVFNGLNEQNERVYTFRGSCW